MFIHSLIKATGGKDKVVRVWVMVPWAAHFRAILSQNQGLNANFKHQCTYSQLSIALDISTVKDEPGDVFSRTPLCAFEGAATRLIGWQS